ncbi:MAG: sulfurtransferase TusA family protein [Nocardioides sp.]
MGDSASDAVRELDCRRLRCPLPIIELARHINEIKVGEVIMVVTADLAARVDVPAWCRLRGQDYLGELRTEDGVPGYLVRRTG